jgi:hypothetical protein
VPPPRRAPFPTATASARAPALQTPSHPPPPFKHGRARGELGTKSVPVLAPACLSQLLSTTDSFYPTASCPAGKASQAELESTYLILRTHHARGTYIFCISHCVTQLSVSTFASRLVVTSHAQNHLGHSLFSLFLSRVAALPAKHHPTLAPLMLPTVIFAMKDTPAPMELAPLVLFVLEAHLNLLQETPLAKSTSVSRALQFVIHSNNTESSSHYHPVSLIN